jgi:hypothetical protein
MSTAMTNPNIILALNPGHLDTPVESATKAATLGAAMQDRQIRQAQIEEMTQANQIRARKIAGQAAVADAVRSAYQGTGDPLAQPSAPPDRIAPQGTMGAAAGPTQSTPATPTPLPQNPKGITPAPGLPQFGTPGLDYDQVVQKLLAGGFVEEAQAISKQQLDWRKEVMDAGKADLDNQAKRIQRLASLAGTVTDGPTLDYAVGQARREGILDPATADQILSQGYSPQTVQMLSQFRAGALTAQQQIDAHQKDLDYNLRLAQFRWDVTKNQPKVAQDWMSVGGQLFTPGMSGSHFQTGLENLSFMGAPESVINAFAKAGADRAWELGVKPEERAKVSNPNLSEVQLAAKALGVDPNTPAGAQAILKKIQSDKISTAQAGRAQFAPIPGMPEPQPTGNANYDQVLVKYPPTVRTAAQGLLDYSTPLSSRIVNTPLMQSAIQAAKEAAKANGEEWDYKNYPTQQALMREATSGRMGREGASANVVLGHLAVLKDATLALKNSDVLLMNRVGNALGIQLGSNLATNYKTIVNRVAPELVQAYVGTGGEMSDRKEAKEDFWYNASPDQALGAISVSAKLLDSKIQAMESRWKGTFGDKKPYPYEGGHVLGPAGQAALEHIQGKAGGGASGTGGGGAGTIRVQIPGHPPGQIPAGAKDQFLRDHPDAKVL